MPRKKSKLTPEQLRQALTGQSRIRELAARHLLLHPELVAEASPEDLDALREYVSRQGWKGLYGHDRGMYRLLRKGVERVYTRLKSDAPAKAIDDAELQRLLKKGRRFVQAVLLASTPAQLNHLATTINEREFLMELARLAVLNVRARSAKLGRRKLRLLMRLERLVTTPFDEIVRRHGGCTTENLAGMVRELESGEP